MIPFHHTPTDWLSAFLVVWKVVYINHFEFFTRFKHKSYYIYHFLKVKQFFHKFINLKVLRDIYSSNLLLGILMLFPIIIFGKSRLFTNLYVLLRPSLRIFSTSLTVRNSSINNHSLSTNSRYNSFASLPDNRFGNFTVLSSSCVNTSATGGSSMSNTTSMVTVITLHLSIINYI